MVQYIANIGFNHNGDVNGMKTILKLCKEEGFDSAKFNIKKDQLFSFLIRQNMLTMLPGTTI